MTRPLAALLLGAVALAGCAPHAVVERDAMRLDRERGTGSLSDDAWLVLREPGPEHPEPPPAPL